MVRTTLIAQKDDYAGEYTLTHHPVNAGVLEYKLSLKPDGTFIFDFYRSSDSSQPIERKYGRGTWKIEKNNLIYFQTTSENDIEESHTLNFNTTKARIIKKSTRNLSKEDVREAILFFESGIFWVEGMKLFKKG